MNHKYEDEIIERFVATDKKERYRFALSRCKHRYAALIKLFANTEIDLRFAHNSSGVVAFAALSHLKDEVCYVLSCNQKIDGQTTQFKGESILDSPLGVLIYFPKSKVAFFRNEDGDEYLLEKLC